MLNEIPAAPGQRSMRLRVLLARVRRRPGTEGGIADRLRGRQQPPSAADRVARWVIRGRGIGVRKTALLTTIRI